MMLSNNVVKDVSKPSQTKRGRGKTGIFAKWARKCALFKTVINCFQIVIPRGGARRGLEGLQPPVGGI